MNAPISDSEAAAHAQALRIRALHRRRDLKMPRDAHAYVRGSTERFYAWLADTQGRNIPQGPTVWICGDAHVGNLGPTARRDEHITVELRDLDQTVIGNPAHDLIRLTLSLAMSVRSSNLPGIVTARLVEELMSGYLDAFAHPENSPSVTESAAVSFVVREAIRRKWRKLHRESLGKKPRFPLGERFLPLVQEERKAVDSFLIRERIRQLVTSRIEAPTWLWASVVELVGIHERAYLEHCRRYALASEKRHESLCAGFPIA